MNASTTQHTSNDRPTDRHTSVGRENGDGQREGVV